MSFPTKQFSTMLKDTRKSNRVRQAELTEALDISLSYVLALECSRNNPSYEMFERIICYFNLSADDVIYPKRSFEDSTLERIKHLLSCCSKQQLRVILTVTKALSGGMEEK